MADWRSRLKEIIGGKPPRQQQEGLSVEEARRVISTYLEQTVVPAFEELRQELERLGREALIERGRFQVSLTVFREGHEEFSFAVRGRAYHKLSFAFPELGSEREPRVCKAEVVLSGGRVEDHEVRTYTKEAIIQDFLDAYGKWMGWTTQEEPPSST